MIGRLLDSVISAVSPVAGLRRMQARRVMRSYLGAEPSRVSSGRNPKNQPADMELLGPFGADRLRAWSRELVRNNAYAWGVVDTIVSSVVGCGIKAQSQFETPAGDDIEDINDRRDKVWSEWCEVCDVNGQYTFDEIQAICQREIVEAGEVIVRFIRTPSQTYRGIYRPVPLALELIEADRIAGDKDNYAARLTPQGDNRIIRGVEVDEMGRPVAYWIYPDHPLQPYAFTRTAERVPASEVMHLFRRDRVGQTRGVTWFAPVVAPIRDLGTYLDNELQASAVASCFTVAIKTETPLGGLKDPDGDDTTDSAGNSYTQVEPGMIMSLKPGEDVVGLNPGRPNSAAEPWIGMILRQIAVGTGLSYETVARDYSQTSYSSSRTSQLEDRRRFRCWQKYLIRHLLQPVWDAFIDAAALSSNDSFPTSSELLSDRRTFAPVEWMTPEWEWVDPQSEQAAAKDAIESFMSDYQTELGARGRSWKAVFYQRAKEQALKQKLGLMTPQEQQLAVSAAQSGGVEGIAASSEQAQPAIGSGEMMGLSTLQFNRNRKAILKTLEDLASGSIGEAAARVFLSSIGMNQANVDALIADTKDGSIDTLPAEAPNAV
jgi:lambda family phage portal protein